jgi:3alpha(or 20beta)-hydroxysteroid dehydrogenase
MTAQAMGRLEGKVALVTGAARGQGEAHVRALAAEGARVVVADVLADEGQAVAGSLGEHGLFQLLDVGDEAHWQAAVVAAVDRFGRLDVLVNNAGIAGRHELLELELETFMSFIRTNQVGPFLGMKTAAPAMIRGGGGSIVNVSSIVGLSGVELVAAYAATKWAVRGLSKSAAVELGGDGIRVNTIFPGVLDTPMTEFMSPEGIEIRRRMVPLGRLGEADACTGLVVFLASDESAYITGAEIAVDGGISSTLWPGLGRLVPGDAVRDR